MGDAGILSPDDRVELIEGQVVRMSPIGIPHASSVDRLTALFAARLGRRAIVRVQNPIVLSRIPSRSPTSPSSARATTSTPRTTRVPPTCSW